MIFYVSQRDSVMSLSGGLPPLNMSVLLSLAMQLLAFLIEYVRAYIIRRIYNPLDLVSLSSL